MAEDFHTGDLPLIRLSNSLIWKIVLFFKLFQNMLLNNNKNFKMPKLCIIGR